MNGPRRQVIGRAIIQLGIGTVLLVPPANTLAQSFRSAPIFSAGTNPASIATADFNGDGRPDLAVANMLSDNISILLADGPGHFAPPVNYAAGLRPWWVAAGDINGDGKPDLAVANGSGGSVSVYLGNGHGGFDPLPQVSVGGPCRSLAIADLNGDGKADLAVAKEMTVAVLLGIGSGGFGPPVDYAVGSNAVSVTTADFNGDGKPDLAVANQSSNNVSILLGNGSGGFGPPLNLPVGTSPSQVVVGDFNGDAKADVAVSNYGSRSVYTLMGDGTGGFGPVSIYAVGDGPWGLVGADLNNDSKLDLAVVNRNGHTVSLLLGNGTGGFIVSSVSFGAGRSPLSIISSDFNNDGKVDLAVANNHFFPFEQSSADVSVLLGDGSGGFPAAALSYRIGNHALSGTAGEFNGDGLPDLAAANQDSADLSVLLGTGGGEFGATTSYSVSGDVFDVVVGDFNGDGKADLAAVKYFASTVAILLGDGIGHFGPPVEYGAGVSAPRELAVGDFNQDGHLDLLVGQWGCAVSLLLGDGTGAFSQGGVFGTGGCMAEAVGVGDLNNDGKVDAVVANYGTASIAVLLGNGSGGFSPPVNYPSGPGPFSIAVTDLNNDGKQDLVVANSNTGGGGGFSGVTVLLGNGSGGFARPSSYPAGDGTVAVAVGDFNGDGRQDVAAANFDSHELSIFAGDGTGGLLPAINFTVGFAPSSLVVRDFDGDGKPDLAVFHAHTAGDVWILLNTTEFRRADLTVALDDGTAVAVPGSPLTYLITVTNLGPDAVTSLKLVDPVPPALLNAVFTPSAGSYNPATSLWAGLNLSAGQSVTLTLSGVVDPMATGTVVDTATVSTVVGVLDPVPANNAATDVDTVAPAANVALTMTDLPDPVPTGGTLTYTLTVSNLGPLQATGLTLVDSLPAAVSFVSASPGPPVCNLSGATVTCALPDLGVGASQVVTIQVTANHYTMAINTASVSANEVDPATGNNAATEHTFILFGGEGELTHGSLRWTDLAALPGPVEKEGLFRLFREPRSSYEVVVDAASGDISGASGVLLQRVGADLVTVLQDSLAVGVGFSRSLRMENASAQAVDEEAIRVRSAGCTTDCGPDDVYRIRAYETTYSIPRFNNAGGQITMLVIQNHGDEPVAGNIWFWSQTGALLASRVLVLGPRGTLVLNTTTIPGLSGVGGSITASNDGSYGVLTGKAVALEPGTGFAFDTPMATRP
jgi:uncharacterized repeat protein (TIGR01451 family)